MVLEASSSLAQDGMCAQRHVLEPPTDYIKRRADQTMQTPVAGQYLR